MFCPNCGAQNDDADLFCAACGTPLREVEAPEEPEFQEYEDTPGSRPTENSHGRVSRPAESRHGRGSLPMEGSRGRGSLQAEERHGSRAMEEMPIRVSRQERRQNRRHRENLFQSLCLWL